MYSYSKKYYISEPVSVPPIIITISDSVSNPFIDEAKILLNYYNNNDINLFNNEINTTYTDLIISNPTYTTNLVSNTTVNLINTLDNLIIKTQITISDTIGDLFINEANILLNYYNNNNIIEFNNEINTVYSNLLINYSSNTKSITANIIKQLINILNKHFKQSQTSIISNVLDISFIDEANTLLQYYYNNNIIEYNHEIDTIYSNLKSTIPTYVNSTTSNVIVQLIDLFNLLLTSNTDLQDQIVVLEQELFQQINENSKIEICKTSINQDSVFKLVYLQYLLMYDITLTDGLFIDTYLQNAQNVLDLNNGMLKHF